MLLNAIEIPDDLEWVDEYSWSPVAQASNYGFTGSLHVQNNLKSKGRFITLAGKSDMAWITRATLNLLVVLRDVPGTEMTLTLQDARTFNVIFRHDDTALDLKTVKGYNDFGVSEYFEVTSIKLMEV